MKCCGICTDPYNKVRNAVECPRCQQSACTRCIKTYLMNNTIEPKCMGCQSAWDMEFVRKNLSKSFLDSEYKKHQISALLSQAEGSLGEMQRFVPIRARIDVLIDKIRFGKERIESIHDDLGGLVQEMHMKKDGYDCFRRMKKTSPMNDMNTRWAALSDGQKQFYQSIAYLVKTRLEDKRAEIRRIRLALDLDQKEKQRLVSQWNSGQLVAAVPESTTEKAVFFMACPRKECRGRVSSVYKCGLCEHWACPDCHVDKGRTRNGPHECRKDDLETVRMLQQNTKNCPECHEGIFKEYGCDQMWCTRCRTCFSWNTGKKLNGTIHNPHYYEYLFQNRGDAAPVPNDVCNGFPEYNQLFLKWSGFVKNDQRMMSNTHRLTNHIRYVELPRLHDAITNHEARNSRKWGIEYLRNNVTREEWGQKLYLAYRKKEREQRMVDILEMFTAVSCTLYRNWYNDGITGLEMIESLHKLVQYVNEIISIHNKQYGTKTAFLDPHLRLDQHILDYEYR